jgi:hypothetical protein
VIYVAAALHPYRWALVDDDAKRRALIIKARAIIQDYSGSMGMRMQGLIF